MCSPKTTWTAALRKATARARARGRTITWAASRAEYDRIPKSGIPFSERQFKMRSFQRTNGIVLPHTNNTHIYHYSWIAGKQYVPILNSEAIGPNYILRPSSPRRGIPHITVPCVQAKARARATEAGISLRMQKEKARVKASHTTAARTRNTFCKA